MQDLSQPVSWAFNVEALEKPRSFQVIQAASQRAYEILDRTIKNAPQVLAPVVADEEALKSAIRGLINSSQVKPQAVQTIAEALENEQITKEYWHTLFDGQGAKTAISQKIYSPQMVRLITLRAMVIPKTLPEFLNWLNVKGGKNKPDENQTVSLEFQSGIRGSFPKEKLADGIKFLLPELLEQKITPEAIYWLLIGSGSAWVYCQKDFIKDIHADLELIPERQSDTFKCGEKIWRQLINHWQFIRSHSYRLEYYKPLAKLFEQLKDYDLSAYFYQVSDGIVPKDVFYEVASQKNVRSNSIPFLGITLEREVTWFENIINFLTQELIVPIQIVISISFLMLTIGLFVGSKFLVQQNSSNELASQRELPENSSQNDSISEYSMNDQGSTVGLTTSNMPPQKKRDATTDKNFQKTREAINQIVEEIHNKQPDRNENEIINEIKSVLRVPGLNYSGVEKPGVERDQLAVAIYLYQKEHFRREEAAFGYMKSGEQTSQSLKKQVEDNLGNK